MPDSDAQRLLGEVLEYTNEGYLIADKEGTILYVNPAWFTLCIGDTKLDREVAGGNIREFRDYIKFVTVAELVMQDHKPHSQVYSPMAKRVILSSGKPLFDEQGALQFILVKVNDISDIFHLRDQVDNYNRIKQLYTEFLKTQQPVEQDPILADPRMQAIYQKCHTISVTDVTVLLSGESGVGKEVAANFIHNQSHRKEKPFVSVNCSAIPETLIESELFGYAPGAFTGASKAGKKGIFQAANGGTLFLDEIGDMPPDMQVKLLRVLETRQIWPVGATKPVDVDLRIIVATNANLPQLVEKGRFRKDLYYRINVISIHIPPLRQRPGDIQALAEHYLGVFNTQYLYHAGGTTFSPELMAQFKEYSWPGNVRELRNVIEQLVILSESPLIGPGLFRSIIRGEGPEGEDAPAQAAVSVNRVARLNEVVEETERQLFEKVALTHRSSREIAKLLDVSQTTVVRKMKKYLAQAE